MKKLLLASLLPLAATSAYAYDFSVAANSEYRRNFNEEDTYSYKVGTSVNLDERNYLTLGGESRHVNSFNREAAFAEYGYEDENHSLTLFGNTFDEYAIEGSAGIFSLSYTRGLVDSEQGFRNDFFSKTVYGSVTSGEYLGLVTLKAGLLYTWFDDDNEREGFDVSATYNVIPGTDVEVRYVHANDDFASNLYDSAKTLRYTTVHLHQNVEVGNDATLGFEVYAGNGRENGNNEAVYGILTNASYNITNQLFVNAGAGYKAHNAFEEPYANLGLSFNF